MAAAVAMAILIFKNVSNWRQEMQLLLWESLK